MTQIIERDAYEHARDNAKGHFEGILDAYRETRGDISDAERENTEDRMRETALSVMVRSGWQSAGETLTANEYQVLLTTGGPALRLWGELNDYGEPLSAQLQMQDWGTPWREVWPCSIDDMDEAREALMWFACLFYYGA